MDRLCSLGQTGVKYCYEELEDQGVQAPERVLEARTSRLEVFDPCVLVPPPASVT